ncbi:MAG: antitoxin (DNA-binding transcriptional repressor) of toxin-antitoxin stability system [Verrucomicrobiales bacterium]|jgi:antitoxin (DNA-binding transcriptional repressor) of toxin-antitoxin stability system
MSDSLSVFQREWRASAARRTALAMAAALFVSCSSLPDVNLTTDEPLKVDISVRLDVYQHEGKEGESSATAATDTGEEATISDDAKVSADLVAKRKRDRMEEIQVLKNNRLVGENHRGLLTIRKLPLEKYGDYVKKTVEDENYDRNYLMRVEAKERGTLLHTVQETTWKENIARSYEGEWIEAPGDQDGTFAWEQKKK